MSYRVEPSAWNTAFAVPAQVVDKHIRLAGATQLKALLWLLRHASENFTVEEMAKAIGQKPADTVDALHYWIECGIISENGKIEEETKKIEKFPNSESKRVEDKIEPKTESETVEKERTKLSAERKTLPEVPIPTPTYEQIIARAQEEPEIQFLFNEAQQILGRTIGFDAQSTLLIMHDQYGLPVEVILMILVYVSSINKRSYSYILSIGRDWGENEIDTIEKADEKITQLRNSNKLWTELAQMAGIANPRPTQAQTKYLTAWSKELGFDIEMIYLAYDQMANNCSKFSMAYMDKVLKTWNANGVKNPQDVEKANELHRSKNQTKSKSAKGWNKEEASYGLDEFNHSSDHDKIVYEKRKK